MKNTFIKLLSLLACGLLAVGFSACGGVTPPANSQSEGSLSSEEISSHEHTYEAVVTDPTCKAGGYTTYTCACGDTYKDNYVDKLEHTPVIDESVEPTCTELGLTVGAHCDVCGTTILPQTPIQPKGHTLDDWYTIKEASETIEGEKRRDCSMCDYYEISPIAILSHSHDRYTPITLEAVAPTCMGTGLTEGEKCGGCEEILIAQETVPALGHVIIINDLVPPTCTETGLTSGAYCERCGETLVEQETVPETGHSYKTTVTEPTCSSQGFTTFVCDCGDHYVGNYTELLPHPYETDWSYNEIFHWHNVTCDCDEKVAYGEHTDVDGFCSVCNANINPDKTLVRNLNTALAANAEEEKTMQDALDAAAEFGYDVAKINNTKVEENDIVWNSDINEFVYNVNGKEKGANIWVIDDEVSETCSTYLWNYNGTTVAAKNGLGLDVGTSEKIVEVKYEYTNDAKAIIRTNSSLTKLTINAPKATIQHFGEVGNVDVQAVDTTECYHENGVVAGALKLTKGKLVVNAGAVATTVIVDAVAAADVVMDVKASATVGSLYVASEEVKAALPTSKFNSTMVVESAEEMEEVFNSVADVNGVHYTDLAAAFNAVAKDGTATTITLLKDVALNNVTGTALKVVAGQNITLDLNGKKVLALLGNTKTVNLISVAGSTSGADVFAELTIKDSIGGGELRTKAMYNSDPMDVSASVISVQRNGKVVIESGSIINDNENCAWGAYAIDVLTNTGAQNVWLTINGGLVESKTYRAIRAFCNSVTGTVNITVNGGTVRSLNNNAIWLQNPNGKADKVALTITGGEIISGGYYNGADRFPLNIGSGLAIEKIITGGKFIQNGTDVSADYNVPTTPTPETAVVVTTADELTTALTDKAEKIMLGADINVINEITNDKGEYDSFTVTSDVEINLNGYNITGVHKNNIDTLNRNTVLIAVKNNATLTLSGVGTISLKYEGTNMQWNALSATLRLPGNGTINVNDAVVVEHLGGTSMSYAIDVYASGTTTAVNLNGGALYSSYIAIRSFYQSTLNNKININAGVIEGVSRDIWYQGAKIDVSESLTVASSYKVTVNDGSYYID